jgi:hypothetical protein
MNKKLKEKLNNLIEESENISFANNSYTSHNGTFGRASNELLSWVSKVEDFVVSNYIEKSGPYKLFESFDRNKLTGYYQKEFEGQITKLIAVLKSCEDIEPNIKNTSKNENVIISLITNYLFWTVLVVVVGASYKLGYDNGNVKFEIDKIELSEENINLKKQLKEKEKIIISRNAERRNSKSISKK